MNVCCGPRGDEGCSESKAEERGGRSGRAGRAATFPRPRLRGRGDG